MHLKDSIAADAGAISSALEKTRRLADQAALPRGARVRLLLVMEEVVANILTHGKPPSDSLIDLQLKAGSDRVEITVRDAGAAFDPRTDIPVASRDRATRGDVEGGAGWPMILEWCVVDAYERDGGLNHLTLSLPIFGSSTNR